MERTETKKVAEAPKFTDAYGAGYDAGLHGGDNFNSHFKWFNSRERLQEWEKGKRDGKTKREML